MNRQVFIKTISIRQPWSWAIIHGGKDVENRTWPSMHIGPLLIHAGKTFDHGGYSWLVQNQSILTAELPARDSLLFKFGGIIGRVKMVDCVDNHPSPFFFGPWGHVYKKPEPLPFYPCKGALSLFNVDYPDDFFKVDYAKMRANILP